MPIARVQVLDVTERTNNLHTVIELRKGKLTLPGVGEIIAWTKLVATPASTFAARAKSAAASGRTASMTSSIGLDSSIFMTHPGVVETGAHCPGEVTGP